MDPISPTELTDEDIKTVWPQSGAGTAVAKLQDTDETDTTDGGDSTDGLDAGDATDGVAAGDETDQTDTGGGDTTDATDPVA